MLKFFKLNVGLFHAKKCDLADAIKNIVKNWEFNQLIYIEEDKIHFLVHRFRGRSLPGKALNNQGGINIGSTPGISNDGAVVRYTNLRYNIQIKKVSDRIGQVTPPAIPFSRFYNP